MLPLCDKDHYRKWERKLCHSQAFTITQKADCDSTNDHDDERHTLIMTMSCQAVRLSRTFETFVSLSLSLGKVFVYVWSQL